MSDPGLEIRIDWWHIALLGAAALGLVALAFGWRPGAILTLLGLGASAEKARRDRNQPDSAEPDPTTTADDRSNAIDEAAGDIRAELRDDIDRLRADLGAAHKERASLEAEVERLEAYNTAQNEQIKERDRMIRRLKEELVDRTDLESISDVEVES